MTDEPGRNAPAHKIVITMGPPPGYHEVASGVLLTCDRCGALVSELGLHDAWHLAAVTRPASAPFEHTGMGVCNLGRIHDGPCDYGNGV